MDKKQIAEIQQADRDYVMKPWSKQGGINPVMTRSKGVNFWDQNDKMYYDMCSQLVYANLGHQHPKMLKAFENIAQNQISAGGFASESKSKLAAEILKVAPDNMGKVYFAMAGAEANERAIRIARMYTGKTKVFSRYRSYHGSTIGASSLTGEARRRADLPLTGFVKFPLVYPYRDDLNFMSEEDYTNHHLKVLEEQIMYEGPDQTAAIVMETIPGSNGVILPPKGYLKGVEQLCKRFEILFICDEVMVGFGRTGKWFAVEHYDVKPDIITFAKGVTAGYLPLGGVIVSKEIAAYFNDNILMTGSTWGGHALSCSIGYAAVKTYQEDNVLDNVNALAPLFSERLEKLRSFKYVGDVRSIGLFGAVEMVKNKETKLPLSEYGQAYGFDKEGLMDELFGILAGHGFNTFMHESTLSIAPPLIINAEEINTAMDLFELALADFEKEYPNLS